MTTSGPEVTTDLRRDGSTQILDQGYRSYTGERLGMRGSVQSLFAASMQRALGLKRPFRFKIVPLITVFLAYVPMIAIVGMVLILGPTFFEISEDAGLSADDMEELGGTFLPTIADSFGSAAIAILLFVAFVGPEVTVTDRRTGMLGMYLASPLTRAWYMASKLASIFTVLLIVTIGPALLLLLGLIGAGLGPDGVTGTAGDIGRIVLSGLLVSAYFTAIAVAISTLTLRNGFASAGIILLAIGTGLGSEVLLDSTDLGGWINLIDIGEVPFDLVQRIFGEKPDMDVSTTPLVLTFVGVMATCVALTWYRYRNAEVSK